MNPGLPSMLAALALSFISGCVTPGRNADLAFQYETRDELFGSWGAAGPLAVGASVDVTVHRHKPGSSGVTVKLGGQTLGLGSDFERVPVEFARSSDPTVLRALETSDESRVRLTGVAPGSVKVTVQSAGVQDSLDIRVAAIARASLDHWLREVVLGDRFASDAAFVKGGTGQFFLQMYDAGGARLVSSAMQPPIAVEPAGAATALTTGEGDVGHASVRFDRAGPVTLLPQKGERLAVQVVDPDEVDALELVELHLGQLSLKAEWRDDHWVQPPALVADPSKREAPTLPGGWREGTLYGVAVRGARKGGGAVVLLGDVARVEGRSPAVCAPEALGPLGPVLGDGITLIRTLAPGACELEVTLGSRSVQTTIAVAARAKEG